MRDFATPATAPTGARAADMTVRGGGNAFAGDALMAMIDQAVDGVVAIDHRNVVTYFNPAAERLWGRPARDVVGRNVKYLVPEAIQDQHDDFVDRHRRTNADRIVGSSRDLEMTRADGETLWINLALSKSVDAEGRIGYLATVKDITKQRRAHAEAEAALADLGETAQKVTDLSGEISLLAEQTHILAINAAIEANRAGDEGRAFGVVAVEVRRLAQRSHETGTQIGALLAETADRFDTVRDRLSRVRTG